MTAHVTKRDLSICAVWYTAFMMLALLSTARNTCAMSADAERGVDVHTLTSTLLLDDKHWHLFRWYFERVPVIELTQLVTGNASGEHNMFHKELTQELSKDSLTLFSVHSVDYDTFNDSITTDDLIQHNTTIQQIYDYRSKHPRKRFRRDEPQLGAVICFGSLTDWETFVTRTSSRQHPFHNPAGHYIFLLSTSLSPESDVWRETIARVMHLIFHKHRILHSIFVSNSISNEIRDQIGYYDPFYRSDNANGSPNDSSAAHSWGALKWTRLQDVDLQTFWILNLAKNFKGYPFRAAMFRRFPTLIASTEMSATFLHSYMANVVDYASNFSGFDGVVLGNLAKHHNFRVVSVLNDAKYGIKLANTTFTGVIGDLINERADAAFNSRFITDYGTDEIDFLYPVFSDRYCVIAPAALPLPKWAVMLRCFRTSVWCILLMAQWCCVLVWFGLRSIRLNRRTSVSIFHRTVLEVCQVLLSQAIRLPAQLRERFFLGTFLITHVIILGIFEGSLTLSFRSSITENEIDTLQQLYDSGLPIISSALSIKNLFGNEDERPLMRSLQAMHKTRENTKAIRLAAFDRTACSVERYSDVKILIKTQYERPDGTALVHVVSQCPRNYHLGYILKKGSPYKARFNRILLNFFEAGLLRAWYDNIEHSMIVSRRNATQSNQLNNVITLNDMKMTFVLWCVGLLIASVVFGLEKLSKLVSNQ